MKRLFRSLLLTLTIIAVSGASVWAGKYEYQTVPGDKMNTLIYTLPNGLKVYMSVNKKEPRIQANIAVRVGGKNDPAETTGLAHYFEHLMFKGTKNYGTTNYAAEEPMLNEIEQLFETYRKTKDEAQRKAIYHRIDSISYEASKLAIPNEYDKLMAAIGANGTNAYTSYDVTCYTENIPNNQIENWAKIQVDRFAEPVLRGFHTELETIYEEKNMSLTQDGRKVVETLFADLFPNHPYGTQSVIGTQENLKNPSITNVKNYHKNWYVPNNMAICLAGDFDPDNMIDIITKYFGSLKPNPNLPKTEFTPEKPIMSPKSSIVMGKEAESLLMGWRLPGSASKDMEILEILESLLSNGKAGLLDLDVNQKQKVLNAGSMLYGLADYSILLLSAQPKEGQTLSEVRDILLEEVEKLRNGEFDESLIEATINNYKLSEQRMLENNDARVNQFVDAFINGKDWANVVTSLDRQAKLTKQDIVDFANKYLDTNNYAIVYKMQGTDPNELKIGKPELTPLEMNRDATSAFLTEVRNAEVTPIEPVFLDYTKDLSFGKTKDGQELIYKHNDVNDVTNVSIIYKMNNTASRTLPYAIDYLDYLGTKSKTAEQINAELYKLACSYSISRGTNQVVISFHGLSENIPQAIALVEDLLKNAVADEEALKAYTERELKYREDVKKNQKQNLNKLLKYVAFDGKNSSYFHNLLSNDEITNLKAQDLINELKSLLGYKYRALYYGPLSQKEAVKMLADSWKTPKKLTTPPQGPKFEEALTHETKIYVAPYEAKQLYMVLMNNLEKKYDKDFLPSMNMYDQYFGGGMNGIVFQEMRERRSLAYSASAYVVEPDFPDHNFFIRGMIATQNDKMMDAIGAFDEILNDMPQSEAAFQMAKEGLLAEMRSNRINGISVIMNYLEDEEMGLKESPRKEIFMKLQDMTLDDVVKFQQNVVKDRKYHYGILGDIKDLDMDALKKMGEVIILTTEDIFGY